MTSISSRTNVECENRMPILEKHLWKECENTGSLALSHSSLFSSSIIFHLSLSLLPLPYPCICNIKVSTSFSFVTTLTSHFPPSNAQFQEPSGATLFGPLLQFLHDTHSSLFINLYPYNLYRLNLEIPLKIALHHRGSVPKSLQRHGRRHHFFPL